MFHYPCIIRHPKAHLFDITLSGSRSAPRQVEIPNSDLERECESPSKTWTVRAFAIPFSTRPTLLTLVPLKTSPCHPIMFKVVLSFPSRIGCDLWVLKMARPAPDIISRPLFIGRMFFIKKTGLSWITFMWEKLLCLSWGQWILFRNPLCCQWGRFHVERRAQSSPLVVALGSRWLCLRPTGSEKPESQKSDARQSGKPSPLSACTMSNRWNPILQKKGNNWYRASKISFYSDANIMLEDHTGPKYGRLPPLPPGPDMQLGENVAAGLLFVLCL